MKKINFIIGLPMVGKSYLLNKIKRNDIIKVNEDNLVIDIINKEQKDLPNFNSYYEFKIFREKMRKENPEKINFLYEKEENGKKYFENKFISARETLVNILNNPKENKNYLFDNGGYSYSRLNTIKKFDINYIYIKYNSFEDFKKNITNFYNDLPLIPNPNNYIKDKFHPNIEMIKLTEKNLKNNYNIIDKLYGNIANIVIKKGDIKSFKKIFSIKD